MVTSLTSSLETLNTASRPDSRGRFGPYGGKFVPETLMPALDELEQAFESAWSDPDYHRELEGYLRNYVGRPTPLYFAEKLTKRLGGAQIWLKREDLLHTGAHKINNTIGQCLLARRMKKPRIIAETGAGQHGVATATAGALFGLQTVIYMGSEDTVRQRLNVYRMRMLGAEVIPVESGSCTLKDAMNEAIRDWVTNVRNTYYVIGTVAGPHPYPRMVREFHRCIGEEAKAQCLERVGRLPDVLIACVGGGSNAIGLFHPFYEDCNVRFIGVEAGGEGIETGRHASSLEHGEPGVLHGQYSYLLQDDDGQIRLAHSISAGLDYPGVGPEHAFYRDTRRAEYHTITDTEALQGFDLLAREEGILPALESAHAIAEVVKLAPQMQSDQVIVVNLSGRGDKDVETAAKHLGAV